MTSVSQTLLPLSYILVVWFKKLLHIFDPFIGKTHVYKYYNRLLWHFLYLSARTCYVKILLFSLTGLFLASVLYVSQNVLLYISSKGEVTWVLYHDHRIYTNSFVKHNSVLLAEVCKWKMQQSALWAWITGTMKYYTIKPLSWYLI